MATYDTRKLTAMMRGWHNHCKRTPVDPERNCAKTGIKGFWFPGVPDDVLVCGPCVDPIMTRGFVMPTPNQVLWSNERYGHLKQHHCCICGKDLA